MKTAEEIIAEIREAIKEGIRLNRAPAAILLTVEEIQTLFFRVEAMGLAPFIDPMNGKSLAVHGVPFFYLEGKRVLRNTL